MGATSQNQTAGTAFSVSRINRRSDVRVRISRVRTTKIADRGNMLRHHLHCQIKPVDLDQKVGQKPSMSNGMLFQSRAFKTRQNIW